MHAIILKGAITIHHNYSSAATSESSLFCQNSRMFRFIWETGWTRFSSWVQVHIQYQPHGANINCRIGPRLNHIELCAPVSSQPARWSIPTFCGSWAIDGPSIPYIKVRETVSLLRFTVVLKQSSVNNYSYTLNYPSSSRNKFRRFLSPSINNNQLGGYV